MVKRYYSSRTYPKSLTLKGLYWKFKNLYQFFSNKDYFKGKAEITGEWIPENIKHEAAVFLNFQPFPITKWDVSDITEERIFDVIEFLFERVSKPGRTVEMTDLEGRPYYDYMYYDDEEGKREFLESVNSFLCDFKNGYELTKDGQIIAMGEHGLQYIFNADIPVYDEQNIDSKVRNAINKWRNRNLDVKEKKQAIHEMADVFEWLKKTGKLSEVLRKKNESDLFEIANHFAIRHHDPKQKKDYDESIWYSWIFHFYLATYHAAIRMLIKNEAK